MNIPARLPGGTDKSQLRPGNSAKAAVDKRLGAVSHSHSSTTSRAELAWF